MAYISKTPSKSLSPALLKIKPGREQFEQFKAKLSGLEGQINGSPNESEEHHKNHISDFLKYAFKFPAYFINTNDRIDLVIHNGKAPTDPVGVIIEAKRPSSQTEMPSQDSLNVKAMQELVLYYLRERVTANNLNVKHLVITNGYEWFIFDAHVFEKAFANNKALVKQFNEFEAGHLSGNTTDFFYREIAKPTIEKMGDVEFTRFDLREENSDKKLIALLKVFSPEHLLKLPFANDSNSLNKDFYSELLHLIGLIEVKEGSKKLIQRKQEGERNRGSLLENAIAKLDAQDRLRHFEKPSLFGETKQEQLFNVGLELVITWVNRILFLKLLEAQLITYHKGDNSYAFLNSQRIKSFDELDTLFFEVLARKLDEREEPIKQAFAKVPYLNSSLFEPTEIESKSLFIGNLVGEVTLPLFGSTVLKDAKVKRRTGELNTLEYLFAFLDAYDFASEGKGELKDDNKALINASVLGLIFEKINGYKDGSFFTPGFITMYMCRETLRRAVVQKFNEVKGWNCNSLTDLYNKIEDRTEANTLINSLKVCDPAVGSGHFLVSALNELIAIKSELGILQDAEGKRLKNYSIEIINDELLVLDEEGDEFSYSPANPESARIQKTLFNEKQTLIENCLFGVDINPNSVKICRLRLWIELLKNAYYNADGQLETLPNIDINIKVGNSLISRFALDTDLKDALKKSKLTLAGYRKAVDTYRNATSKEQKREMEKLIAEIKNDFRTEILYHDPKAKKLENMRAELKLLELPQTLLEEPAKEKKERKQKQEKLKLQFDKLNVEIEEIKNNKIYENAFEWRFEFPEALNDEGVFAGFDVVIGNPPYIFTRELISEEDKVYFNTNYMQTQFKINLYFLFVERAWRLLNVKGAFAFIIPNNWLTLETASNFRKFILGDTKNTLIVNCRDNIFDNASVDSSILIFDKFGEQETIVFELINGSLTLTKQSPSSIYLNNKNHIINYSQVGGGSNSSLLEKIDVNSVKLESIAEVRNGIQAYTVGEGTPPLTDEMKNARVYHSKVKKGDDWLKYVDGVDVGRYKLGWSGQFVKYGNNLSRPRKNELFINERLLVRQIPSKPPYSIFSCYVNEIVVNDNNSMVVTNVTNGYNLKTILALINSRLISYWFLQKFGKLQRKVFPQFKVKELREFPIKYLDFSSAKDIELQNILINLVDDYERLSLNGELADTLEAVNIKIDRIVYALYGLTPEEIALVEGNAEEVLSVPNADAAEVCE